MNCNGLRIVFIALISSSVWAQIGAPSPGFLRSDSSQVEIVYGVPGSLITAPAAFGNAGAIAFGDRFGVIATSGRIVLVRRNGQVMGSIAASDVAPVLHIDGDAASAVAWLPESRTALYWDKNGWQQVMLRDSLEAGPVTAIVRDSAQTARLLLTTADGSVEAVRVSLASGDVASTDVLPGVRGPAFQFGSQMVWADGRGLEIGSAGGVVEHTLELPAPGAFSAERMSAQWVHLYFPGQGGSDWALHLGSGEPTLSRLPVAGGKR